MKEALIVALGLVVVKKKLMGAIALFALLMVHVTLCSPRMAATVQPVDSAPHGSAVLVQGE